MIFLTQNLLLMKYEFMQLNWQDIAFCSSSKTSKDWDKNLQRILSEKKMLKYDPSTYC